MKKLIIIITILLILILAVIANPFQEGLIIPPVKETVKYKAYNITENQKSVMRFVIKEGQEMTATELIKEHIKIKKEMKK